MSNLLSSEFIRIFKSKLFWICVSALTLISFLDIFISLGNLKELGVNVLYRSFFFGITGYICIVMTVFSGLFVGAEYSDNTIRNKLIAGHTRTEVYCSYFITELIASAIMFAVPVIADIGVGFILIGAPNTTFPLLIRDILFCWLALALMTAIVLLVVFLLQKKSGGSVSAVLLSVFLQFYAMNISYALTYQEVDGTRKELYIFLMHILPAGYLMEILGGDLWLEKSPSSPVWVLLLTVLISLTGAFVFQRKDLK